MNKGIISVISSQKLKFPTTKRNYINKMLQKINKPKNTFFIVFFSFFLIVFIIKESYHVDADFLIIEPTVCSTANNDRVDETEGPLLSFSKKLIKLQNKKKSPLAIFSEKESEIICGEFDGEIPEGKENTIVVNFSWTLKDKIELTSNSFADFLKESIQADLNGSTETVVADVSEKQIEKKAQESTQQQLGQETEQSIQADLDGINETIVSDEFEDKNPLEKTTPKTTQETLQKLGEQSIQSNLDKNEIIVADVSEKETLTEKAVEKVIEKPIEKPAEKSESEISVFLQNIFTLRAYAQEISNNQQSITESAEESIQADLDGPNEIIVADIFSNDKPMIRPVPEIPTAIVVEEESIQSGLDNPNETIVSNMFDEVKALEKPESEIIETLIIENNVSENFETEIQADMQPEPMVVQKNQFEAYYSIDGETFISLGYIDNVTENSFIRLPSSIFAEPKGLENLKISVRALDIVDTQKISLDNMWLGLKPPEKDIVLDTLVLEFCEEESYEINMTGLTSLDKRFIMKGGADGEYEMKIGKLPQTASIIEIESQSKKDIKSNRYLLEEEATEIIIHIDNSNKTGFTLPITYTKKGDNPGTVICNIKIYNDSE